MEINIGSLRYQYLFWYHCEKLPFCFLFFLIFTPQISASSSLIKPLRILVHDSFKQVIGADNFFHPVEIKFVTGSKLRLMLMWGKALKKNDIVIGLIDEDIFAQESAQKKVCFEKLGVFVSIENLKTKINIPWDSDYFMPFGYAYVGFLVKIKKGQENKKRNANFNDFHNFSASLKNNSLILSDPRFSSIGRVYQKWIQRNFKGITAELQPKILTHTKGWSGAFSLFKQPQVQAMVGYNTTAIFYQKNPLPGVQVQFVKIKNILAPLQVFSVGILKKKQGHHPYIRAALNVLLSQTIQEKMTEAYLYPVTDTELPKAFAEVSP